MLTQEQRNLLQQILSQVGDDATSLIGQLLQPQGEATQEVFQQTYVEPAMQALNQQIAPAIQQRFADANASSSSALNQALAQAASQMSTNIGSQYGQFLQGQQGMGLSALLPLITNQTFTPIIQQRQGLASPLIGAAGQIGAASMMPAPLSTREAKENIRDYKKALAQIRDMSVKQYDYKKEFGGQKDRVGLIAEDLPEELTVKKDGLLHVDLYGLLGLAINGIKMLEARVAELEGEK